MTTTTTFVFCAGATPFSLNVSMYAGLTLVGQVGSSYEMAYKTNVDDTNWLPLATVALSNSPYLFIDTNSASASHRFYRALQLPWR